MAKKNTAKQYKKLARRTVELQQAWLDRSFEELATRFAGGSGKPNVAIDEELQRAYQDFFRLCMCEVKTLKFEDGSTLKMTGKRSDES